ncbi:class I SAM-dependent methyltransferase [Mucilaginibacter sp. SMC90]|uniref:class I SAM-dependent methyltransferase n=1 Tax=Mucilaginibacter sp. SMC90 TaxID=2929803 RepID=UPI001FB245AB|nr:class I SAM-dependent methyltransferase [Mucilaginibacter sp. SMC90]UOE51017.1 class I SAM-dependent methyltransferase [Mucilaginibacter sp. SMC90]
MKKVNNKTIIAWDVENWSRALTFWEEHCPVTNKEFNCLELGSSKGGLSLWLALKGNNVYCTDLNGPEQAAHDIHNAYDCGSRITYGNVDATNIPFENSFDIIVFKSIMGGISFTDPENKQRIIDQIYKALKPNGRLLFAENLESTFMHRFFRKKFGTRGWNYLTIDEVDGIFSSFKSFNYTTTGFFGCFGRNEWQRNVLGKIDKAFEYFIPFKNRYIIVGQAVK